MEGGISAKRRKASKPWVGIDCKPEPAPPWRGAIDGSSPVSIVAVRGGCRWPLFDKDGEEKLVCGADASGTYCTSHHKLGYKKGRRFTPDKIIRTILETETLPTEPADSLVPLTDLPGFGAP
jgi:hypothetical protein